MTPEDEAEAVAYAEKHNQPFLDYDCLTDEEIQYYHDRMSCDGCAQNATALKFAYLAALKAERERRYYKLSEKYPKIGQDIIAWYRLPGGKLTWCAGTVDGSDDGLFIDYEFDGLDLKDCEYWCEVLPPTEEK